MLRKASVTLAPIFLLLACGDSAPLEPASDVSPQLAVTAAGGRPASPGYVYVRSQGLYYDTFAATETLPPHGRFQKLENGATDYGPGDPGYLGGRWWVDSDGDGVQDPDDKYFLCPLLGPGRTSP